MNRGPLPHKAIEIAMPVALARGFVILCRHYYGYVCDMIIAERGRTSIVRIIRTRRLYDTVAGMAGQFRAGIAGLCRVLSDPGRSLEIWASDYYGNLRFFRVAGTGLQEIDQHGTLLDPEAGVAGAEAELPATLTREIPTPPGGGNGRSPGDSEKIPLPAGEEREDRPLN